MLAAGGCDGDDEDEPNALAPTPMPGTETQLEPPPATDTAPARTAPDDAPSGEPPPEEDQPGGAGDEEPIRSDAIFTGGGGRITPRTIRVAPYIAVRIELRSADGAAYGLACGSRTLRVDGEVSSAQTRLAGRLPGERLVCRPLGDHNGVAVDPSAEPGP